MSAKIGAEILLGYPGQRPSQRFCATSLLRPVTSYFPFPKLKQSAVNPPRLKLMRTTQPLSSHHGKTMQTEPKALLTLHFKLRPTQLSGVQALSSRQRLSKFQCQSVLTQLIGSAASSTFFSLSTPPPYNCVFGHFDFFFFAPHYIYPIFTTSRLLIRISRQKPNLPCHPL